MPILRDDLRAASQPQTGTSPTKAVASPKKAVASPKKSAEKNQAAN
jgi:hypothetical protein